MAQIENANGTKQDLSEGSRKPIERNSTFRSTKQGILSALDERVGNPKQWIINNLIAKGEQLLLFGPPKVGKSQFALQLAIAAATGEQFNPWPKPTQRHKVLYVNLEIDEQAFMLRMAGHVLRDSNRKHFDEPFKTLDEGLRKTTNNTLSDFFLFTDSIRFLIFGDFSRKKSQNEEQIPTEAEEENQESMKIIRSAIAEHSPSLIIYDTLSKMHNADENDNISIQQILMQIRRFSVNEINKLAGDTSSSEKEFIAHIIVHHSRKRSTDQRHNNTISIDDMRGGSAIRAEADTIFGIGPAGHPDDNGNSLRQTIIESRNLPPSKPWFTFNGVRFEQIEKEAIEKKESEEILNKFKTLILKYRRRGFPRTDLILMISENKSEESFEWKKVGSLLSKLSTDGAHFISVQKRFAKSNDSSDKEYDPDLVFNHAKKNCKVIYWVHNRSKWMEDQAICEAVKPTPGSQLLPSTENRTQPSPNSSAPVKSSKKSRIEATGDSQVASSLSRAPYKRSPGKKHSHRTKSPGKSRKASPLQVSAPAAITVPVPAS